MISIFTLYLLQLALYFSTSLSFESGALLTERDNDSHSKSFDLRSVNRTTLGPTQARSLITTTDQSWSSLKPTGDVIPGLMSEGCFDDESGTWDQHPPCDAYCLSNDTACRDAASSIVATCGPSWTAYVDIQMGSTLPTGGSRSWSWASSVFKADGETITSTWSIYTSFSTASRDTYINADEHTVTAVYALGKPIITSSVFTEPGDTAFWLTAPTPQCRYSGVEIWVPSEHRSYASTSEDLSTSCGQCTLHGGNVQLYFWPLPLSSSHVDNRTTSRAKATKVTSILNGTTLVSPTVYISLHNIYAENECDIKVGSTLTSTLLAMNPTDVSTLVHIGGMVAQSGANHYGPLNYHHLTGPAPFSEYEMQPSCIWGGCPTIYPTPVNPTLVVPSEVRNLDPAWANCAAGLEGLYDPPVALAAQATMAVASTSTTREYRAALPCITPSLDAPKQTWTAVQAPSSPQANVLKSLANIVSSTVGAQALQSETVRKITEEMQSSSKVEPAHEGPKTKDVDRKITQTTTGDTPTEFSKVPGLVTSASQLSAHALNTDASRIVVVHGTTLEPGHVDAIRSGSSATIASLLTHAEGTSIVYDEKSTASVYTSQIANVGRTTATPGHPNIAKNSRSQFIVYGKTLAPSSPITLHGTDGPVTFRMLTFSSGTYIAIDSSTTLALDTRPATGGSDGAEGSLKFTQAADGNFVLHGTTLASGKPITIGTGGSETTLRLNTINNTQAIVLDGTATNFLAHDSLSRTGSSLARNDIVPTITETHMAAQISTVPSHANTILSTSSHSESGRIKPDHVLMVLSSVLLILWS